MDRTDLPQLVDRAVGLLGHLRQTRDRRFAAYRETDLAEAQVHDLIVRVFDAHVLRVTRIPNLLAEWREPRHPEFREGHSAWRLFSAFTKVLKGTRTEPPRRTQALPGPMDAVCGLV